MNRNEVLKYFDLTKEELYKFELWGLFEYTNFNTHDEFNCIDKNRLHVILQLKREGFTLKEIAHYIMLEDEGLLRITSHIQLRKQCHNS